MKIMEQALAVEFNDAVFTPAAKLLSLCTEAFGNRITCNTVHSGFHIPVLKHGARLPGNLPVHTGLSRFHPYDLAGTW